MSYNSSLFNTGNDKLALYSQVAHMYYELGMQQPEIAKQLFFSKSKVSRILDKAKELGIVDIKVKHFYSRIETIEKQLKTRFHVRTPFVLTSFNTETDNADSILCEFAAIYISEQLQGDCILGITGSHNVTKAVHMLKKRNDCNLKVVQTIGASINQDMSADLVSFLAKNFNAKAFFLNTPVYVDDLEIKNSLLKQPSVLESMQLMKKCDIMLMSIGAFDRNREMPVWWGYLNEQHRDELSRSGAVGCICAQFFDRNGNRINCEWNEKCIAIPWEDFKKAKNRIVIARGENKVNAILGALRGNLVDVLITDAVTALSVLKEDSREKMS